MGTRDATSQRGQVFELLANLWVLAQAWVALFVLYSLIAHVVGELVAIGNKTEHSDFQALLGAVGAVGVTVSIDLPAWWAEILIGCTVLAVLTWTVLEKVCDWEIVKHRFAIKDCWKEVKWYNPFSWVYAIVCSLIWVTVYILEWVCKWRKILVTALWLSCIVGGFVLVYV